MTREWPDEALEIIKVSPTPDEAVHWYWEAFRGKFRKSVPAVIRKWFRLHGKEATA